MALSSPLPAAGTANPPPESLMSPARVVLFLAMLLGIQPVTTDLYLPALPALTEGFGASMTQAQLTFTALLLAFGVSQLVWGPLSDRFGRKPILLWGMGAYTFASIVCAFAPSMPLLILARAVQGAAMGAAVMCARAIVRDLYTPEPGARAMSRGLTGLGFIACVCAPLGGLLSDVFSWRVALVAPAVFGAVLLWLLAARFDETLTRRNPHALRPATLARTWMQIVRNPTFISWCAIASFSYAGLFTFLSASSFIFIRVQGLTKTQYGLVMFAMSAVYIAGTLVCRRLLVRFGLRRTVALAGGFTLLGGSLMGVLAIAGVHTPAALIGPFFIYMLAHGVHQPCSQSAAVSPFPQAAGAASALNGFVMMVMAFIMGGWLGRHMDGTVYPLAFGLWFWSALIALAAWTLVQRHGEVPHEPAPR